MSNILEKALKEAGVSSTAGTAYVRLFENGPTTARQLAVHMGVPRPSVYGYLQELIHFGLVAEEAGGRVKRFAAEKPRHLAQLLKEKSGKLQSTSAELLHYAATLHSDEAFLRGAPGVRYYFGATGVRNVLRELLWYENIETLTMWPIRDMVEIVGREYLEQLNRRRIHQHISIRGIWPQEQLVNLAEYQFLGIGPKHLRTMHVAAHGITWPMSYWLFGDKVAFISSKQEGFSLLVSSRDFAQLMRVQFEAMWQVTKPFVPPKYKDDFLPTV